MEEPTPPDESDCCNSGCNPCILDVYEEQLRKYKANKADLLHKKGKNCISQTTYTIFKCIERIRHTDNSYLFIFEYYKPYRESTMDSNDRFNEDLHLNYKPGQHFLLRTPEKYYEHFTRAYTPIPFDNLTPLSFCVLIKLYEGGIMSRYLRNIDVGSETLWRGPYYDFDIDYTYKFVLMVAQGTGIAPLYAILKEMLNNDECETFIKLFYCCRSSNDIFLREELYGCLSYWNFTYEVFLSVNDGVNVKYNEIIHDYKLDKGYIKSYLSDKSNRSTRVLICGNDLFIKGVSEDLVELNVSVCTF
ncbi:nadh-cytochrome b5 reductase [Holotrichia oblita]|uniref:Nadh-cytochrome b5 reductase n=1 Tax=Holotrichia oblita TaxID=644536 RepID=A0ACB9SMX0_HOLOL|nr:nadh-cytochrome b5 reductase [Holotrichia oblita]